MILLILQLVFCKISTQLAVTEHSKSTLSSALGLTSRQSLQLHRDLFTVKHEVLFLTLVLKLLPMHLQNLSVQKLR